MMLLALLVATKMQLRRNKKRAIVMKRTDTGPFSSHLYISFLLFPSRVHHFPDVPIVYPRYSRKHSRTIPDLYTVRTRTALVPHLDLLCLCLGNQVRYYTFDTKSIVTNIPLSLSREPVLACLRYQISVRVLVAPRTS